MRFENRFVSSYKYINKRFNIFKILFYMSLIIIFIQGKLLENRNKIIKEMILEGYKNTSKFQKIIEKTLFSYEKKQLSNKVESILINEKEIINNI